MIVKILRKSKTFGAVRYNTNKVDKNKGELLKISGFKAIEGLTDLKPQDYINYLTALSARNTRIVYPQFHAMISSKGRLLDKHQLTNLAEQWLQGMGYGDQPYLLIFHRDTKNNHIHLVSSRVDRTGKKISDRFENIRAYEILNRLTGEDMKVSAENAIKKALRYKFSTHAQFIMILERQGYSQHLINDKYSISKFGNKLAEVDFSRLDKLIPDNRPAKSRKLQLQQIFEKYALLVDGRLYQIRENSTANAQGKLLGYSSLLCDNLSSAFGLEFVFHFKDQKLPFGYTILDHSGKNVFKGSEIMALSKMISAGQNLVEVSGYENHSGIPEPATNNSAVPDEEMSLLLTANNEPADFESEQSSALSTANFSLEINLSDDIDDEQILGRNRRRQRKARTNTR